MELGIILHMDFGPEVSPQQAWEDVEAQVRLAKEAGFDWVWTATEIGWRRFDALSAVVAVAALRTGLGVGSAVIILPLYNPVHVAQTFALVDILTGGQCVLGVGQGWREEEFAAAGVDFRRRFSRYVEGVQVIRRLWRDEEAHFHGRHFRLEGVSLYPRPLRPGGPPIWVGVHSPKAIRRVALLGDGWIAGSFTDIHVLQRQVSALREALAEAGRTDYQVALMREAFVARSFQDAQRAVEPYLRDKFQEYQQRVGAMPFDLSQPFSQLARGRFVMGSPEECVDQILTFLEVTGAHHFYVRMRYRGMPLEAVRDSMMLLGREVWPKVKAARS
jgi:probable F420-dependent oxidoreductase